MPAPAADRSATSMKQTLFPVSAISFANRPRSAPILPAKGHRDQRALQRQILVRGIQRHQYPELRCAHKLRSTSIPLIANSAARNTDIRCSPRRAARWPLHPATQPAPAARRLARMSSIPRPGARTTTLGVVFNTVGSGRIIEMSMHLTFSNDPFAAPIRTSVRLNFSGDAIRHSAAASAAALFLPSFAFLRPAWSGKPDPANAVSLRGVSAGRSLPEALRPAPFPAANGSPQTPNKRQRRHFLPRPIGDSAILLMFLLLKFKVRTMEMQCSITKTNVTFVPCFVLFFLKSLQ